MDWTWIIVAHEKSVWLCAYTWLNCFFCLEWSHSSLGRRASHSIYLVSWQFPTVHSEFYLLSMTNTRPGRNISTPEWRKRKVKFILQNSIKFHRLNESNICTNDIGGVCIEFDIFLGHLSAYMMLHEWNIITVLIYYHKISITSRMSNSENFDIEHKYRTKYVCFVCSSVRMAWSHTD